MTLAPVTVMPLLDYCSSHHPPPLLLLLLSLPPHAATTSAHADTACALVVAACGGGDSSSSSSGGGGGASSSASSGSTVTGAKVIDPASMDNPPKGTINYCQGKDTTGAAHELIVRTSTRSTRARATRPKLTEFPASADQQRAQFIQRQQAKSDDCDVFSSDVIWTAEFASQKWLYDMTPYIEQAQGRSTSRRRSRPSTTAASTGASRRRATPRSSTTAPTRCNGEPPATWQDGLPEAKPSGRHRLPGRAVRGPDLRLPRARVRGRRQGALRRRQEVRRSTRRRTSRRCSSWSTASRTARPRRP